MSVSKVIEYLDTHSDRHVEELRDFLRIPSISTSSAHKKDIERAAEFVRSRLEAIGVSATREETGGHPAIVGSWMKAPPGSPTVLFYGHYDVQPADPLDLWHNDPFDPVIRDGNVYARGAMDDKGQMMTHVHAVEGWLRATGSLPCNVKFIVEGEEEVASEHLPAFVERYREALACDIVVVSDGPQFAPGMPAITYGLRGIIYFEITVKSPAQDLHSGTFGGTIPNPVNVLCKALGDLINRDGIIQLKGFYDDVVPLDPDERSQFASLPFNESEYLRQLEVDVPFGEAGYSTLERRWARPTCDVNGIWGGYSGEGVKTIIPHCASAKLSFRLVPHQKASKIADSLRPFFEERIPRGAKFHIKQLDGRGASLFTRHGPYVRAASRAIEAGFGIPPVLIREGSSVPIVNSFKELLGADSLMLGWGLAENNMHSPNEKFRLVDFRNGARSCAYLLHELSR